MLYAMLYAMLRTVPVRLQHLVSQNEDISFMSPHIPQQHVIQMIRLTNLALKERINEVFENAIFELVSGHLLHVRIE